MKPTEYCSRTFITFTEEPTFHEVFKYSKVKAPIKQYCPVTRLPAKYFDPITKTPYANAQAFRLIREAYQQQIESGSEKKERRRTSSAAALSHIPALQHGLT